MFSRRKIYGTSKIQQNELNKIIRHLMSHREYIIQCWIASQGDLTYYR